MRVCLFFFFKQKTAYESRISDWSADVCSSDLRQQDERAAPRRHAARDAARIAARAPEAVEAIGALDRTAGILRYPYAVGFRPVERKQHRRAQRHIAIGRASWRERGCQYV